MPASIFFSPVFNNTEKFPYPQLNLTYRTDTTVSAITDAIAAPSAPKCGIINKFKIRFTTDPAIK